MALTMAELSGRKFKSALKLTECFKSWHNRNKSGGNFGFALYPLERKLENPAFEVIGYHDIEGRVTALKFGTLYGHSILKFNCEEIDFDALCKKIEEAMAARLAL